MDNNGEDKKNVKKQKITSPLKDEPSPIPGDGNCDINTDKGDHQALERKEQDESAPVFAYQMIPDTPITIPICCYCKEMQSASNFFDHMKGCESKIKALESMASSSRDNASEALNRNVKDSSNKKTIRLKDITDIRELNPASGMTKINALIQGSDLRAYRAMLIDDRRQFLLDHCGVLDEDVVPAKPCLTHGMQCKVHTREQRAVIRIILQFAFSGN